MAGASDKATGLKRDVDGAIERIAHMADEAAKSEAVREYLSVMSRFHKYSIGNQMLIMMQNRNATRVAGYKTWLSLKRYVKRGEHGIAILVPYKSTRKATEDDDDDKRPGVYFGTGHVFDIAQTDGEPLPEVAWSGGNGTEAVYNAMLQAARALGYSVQFKAMSANGCTDRKTVWLSSNRGPAQWAETLAHELGHCVLPADAPYSIGEVEAEAVAYVVMAHFGTEDGASANYIALWDGKREVITARLDRIRKAATAIIEAAGEPEAEAEQEAA